MVAWFDLDLVELVELVKDKTILEKFVTVVMEIGVKLLMVLLLDRGERISHYYSFLYTVYDVSLLTI